MFSKEKAKILIVDDIEANRFTLERRLKRDGFTDIHMAENGDTALALTKENDYDLLLLDLMMPGISGLEVLKIIKADPRQRFIPVIMVTASDEIDTAAECIINGADDFITKPFNATLLRARVEACLERKRLRDTEEKYFKRIEADKKRTQEVLKTVLPSDIAAELQGTGYVRSRRYDDVAIMICDLVGFTSFCEQNNPELVVETLQKLVEEFEDIFIKFGLMKIKTVGDAIVALGGLNQFSSKAVKSCVDASSDLKAVANNFSPAFGLHVGIHMGSLVAGTVGKKTIQFDILGRDVNVAFNICDISENNQTLLSNEAWMCVRDEVPAKSIGLSRLKSGMEIELFEF